MKYLLINKIGDTFTTISAEERAKVIKESGAFYAKYRKAGKLKEMYVIPNLKKNVGIWEVETAEEIDKLFMENPASPYMDSEFYLLSSWEAHEKSAKELFG